MNYFKLIKKFLLSLFTLIILSNNLTLAQNFDAPLSQDVFAPDFIAKDIDGVLHSINKFKGKKVLLTFYRSASCPVSFDRLMDLESDSAYFKEHNVVVIEVYNALLKNVLMVRDTNKISQLLIADPNSVLFNKYNVEENKNRCNMTFLNNAGKMAKNGRKMLNPQIIEKEKSYRLPAEFLISETGNIIIAHYGKKLGDNLSIDKIKQILDQ